MEISFTNGWRTVFPDGGRNSRRASCGGSMNGYAGHRASMGDLCRHAAKDELRKAGETSCAANDHVRGLILNFLLVGSLATLPSA